MFIIREDNLHNFDTWSGANYTKNRLTYYELDLIEEHLTDLFPKGMTETEINDFLWFETDTIAEWLGYKDWDELMEDENR